jgi:hypothetical protein
MSSAATPDFMIVTTIFARYKRFLRAAKGGLTLTLPAHRPTLSNEFRTTTKPAPSDGRDVVTHESGEAVSRGDDDATGFEAAGGGIGLPLVVVAIVRGTVGIAERWA